MFSFFWSLPKAHDHWLINWELHFQSRSTLKLLHCYWILFMKFAIFLMSAQNSKTQLRACSTFWMRQLVFDSHVCSAHLTQAISFYFNQRTHLDETCDCSWVTPALLYNAATWFIFDVIFFHLRVLVFDVNHVTHLTVYYQIPFFLCSHYPPKYFISIFSLVFLWIFQSRQLFQKD